MNVGKALGRHYDLKKEYVTSDHPDHIMNFYYEFLMNTNSKIYSVSYFYILT